MTVVNQAVLTLMLGGGVPLQLLTTEQKARQFKVAWEQKQLPEFAGDRTLDGVDWSVKVAAITGVYVKPFDQPPGAAGQLPGWIGPGVSGM